MASDPRVALLRTLETDGDDFFSGGRQNNVTDVVLSIAGVVGSLVATVMASTKLQPWALATTAAVPAACTAIQRIVDLRGRSAWYFVHAARIRALAGELRYADSPDLLDFERRRGALEVEMESRWPGIGRGAASAAAAADPDPRQPGPSSA